MEFKHHEKIRNYLIESVVGSLGGHRVACLEGADHEELLKSFEDIIFTSMLSFEHTLIKGSVMLCCDADMLTATCPGFHAEREKATAQARFEDWLGELTNLIVGRLKNFLLSHQVRIQMRPPSVSMSPASILASYAERMPSQAFWFSVDDTRFCLQLSAEVSDDLDFYTILDKRETVPRPGDVVMTLNAVNRSQEAQEPAAVKTIFMNPVAKPTAKTAAPAPSRGTATGNVSGIGDFNGLAWLDDRRIALRFRSGAEIRLDMQRMEPSSSRTLSVGGIEVEITNSPQGLSCIVDGISIFLPMRAA